LAAKVQELEAAEPIQGSLSKELAAAHKEIEELEEELRIEKCRSAKLEKQATEQSDIAKLQLERDKSLD